VRSFTSEELTKYGLPSINYSSLAQQIIDATLHELTQEEIQTERGQLLTQEKVTKAIYDFLAAHHLENDFSLLWSADFVSRASLTDDNVIKLRLPCAVYEEDLTGLLYHEIGTHALRRINYQQQPWYLQKRKFGFAPYLKTEEGLAVLHGILPKKNRYVYLTAINYLADQLARSSSFLEVWHFVRRYITDQELAFSMTFKKKRGLTDTNRPGGFSKDFVYFEGLVEVTRFLIKNQFPIKELYFGKISWQDIKRAVELSPDFEPVLPIFYTQNPQEYQRQVHLIAETNFLV
jgi:hypothetical protein